MTMQTNKQHNTFLQGAAGAMQVCLLYFSTCLLHADLFGVGESWLDNVVLSSVVDGGYNYKSVGATHSQVQ